MVKKIVVIFLMLQFSFILAKNNNFVLSQETYFALTGLWDCNGFDSSNYGKSNFSWGKSFYSPDAFLVIDLGKKYPEILTTGGLGGFRVTRIDKKNNQYDIEILFRDNNKYVIQLILLSSNEFYIVPAYFLDEIPFFAKDYGEKKIYKKIDGPLKKYYCPIVEDLLMRESYGINFKVLRVLKKDEKLIILEQGEGDVISGRRGNWVKILTDKNEIGWCFDAYLEECR